MKSTININLLYVSNDTSQPLLITEDGVSLYCPDDPCWYVDTETLQRGRQLSVLPVLADNDHFKYFSTKKAAKEYVRMERAVRGIQEKIRQMEAEPEDLEKHLNPKLNAISALVNAMADWAKKGEWIPEAIKCDTKEQWDFLWIRNGYKQPCAEFGYKDEEGDVYNTISIEKSLTYMSDTWYSKQGYSILPFSTFLTREHLEKEWEAFLVKLAEEEYPKGTKFIPTMRAGSEGANASGKYSWNGLYICDRESEYSIYFAKDGKWATIIPPSSPKSQLSPSDLKDGEIYVSELGNHKWIYRFKSLRKSPREGYIYTDVYSCIDFNNDFETNRYYCIGSKDGRTFRPATPSEARTLIRAEIAHDYFHGLTE